MDVSPVSGAQLSGPAAAAAVRVPVQQVVAQVARSLGIDPGRMVAMLERSTMAQVAERLGMTRDQLYAALRQALVSSAAVRTSTWNAVVLDATVRNLADQQGLATMAYLTMGGGLVAASQQAARAARRHPELLPVRRRPHDDGRSGDGGHDEDDGAYHQPLPGTLTSFLDDGDPPA